jgi:hypothetical protein
VADTASDDNTGWTPFLDYCIERAARIPTPDKAASFQEAQRLTLEQIYRQELELSWLDADGRKHAGLPAGWFGFGPCGYDNYRDAIFEALPISGRVLYRPQVRERRRRVDKPADEVVAPVVASDELLIKPDESVKEEPTKPNESVKDELDEPTKPDESASNEWPWRKGPELRGKEGSEIQRIQQAFEEHFEPTSVRGLSVKGRTEKLAEFYTATESSVRRAFGER